MDENELEKNLREAQDKVIQAKYKFTEAFLATNNLDSSEIEMFNSLYRGIEALHLQNQEIIKYLKEQKK